MIVSTMRKQMQMEARDINYALGAYVLSYLYASHNEDPKEIIFPKFPAVPHPRIPGVLIPIKYVEVDEPIVQEIIEDGKDIPETPIEEVPRDEEIAKEEVAEATEKVEDLIEQVKELKEEQTSEELSPARAALAKAKAAAEQTDRQPKMPPGGDIGVGHPDGMGGRDVGFDRKIARDLKPEAKVDESKELEAEIEKPA